MEAGVKKLLRSVPSLSVVDDDIAFYLSSMIADLGATATADAIFEAAGAFLENSGLCDSEAAAKAACVTLHSGMLAAGLVKAAPAAAPKATGGSGSGAYPRGGEGDDDEEDGAPAAKLLSAPVKLGAQTVDSKTLDYMWGKESNAFLKQNQLIDHENDPRFQKKAARLEKKEADRARAEQARQAAAAEHEAAVAARAGTVSAGAVTYNLTADRKQQDIALTGVNVGYGGELLLENAELKINMGRRYGLVGRNGMGKSTLLRHMARGDVHGAGAQRFPPNIRVLHVEQEITGDDTPVLEAVLMADVERTVLMAEEARLLAAVEAAESKGKGDDEDEEDDGEEGGSASAPKFDADAAQKRLREIAARLDALDADSAEARASAILAGLQFTTEMQAWPTRALSGGWRMRVALAQALFVQPDILCLDEPTNHLDVPAVAWLERYLLEYANTLIVVSHDRRFLNNVSTDVIHLYDKRLDYYKGDYDTFERTRAERRRHHEKAAESQAAKREHIQAFINKFRYNAKRASLVQSRIKALERMELLEDVADDPRWKFEFPDPGALGIPVLQVSDVAFGYKADKPLFRGVNFGVDMSSRIAVVGPNGAGKSTLLKLIMGELEPQEGHVARNPKLRVACFTQHHVTQLDLTANPVDYMLRLFPGSKPDAVRAHLGSFGLSGDLALQRIGTLSGGQKSRVAFAIMSWKKPHLIILDEPTNHLDIETIDAVIVALGNFNGAVILVSHDQHFIESVADEIWIVGQVPGRVSKFSGEFEAYRKVAMGEKAVRGDVDD